MKRKDILKSPEYWFDVAQNELFRKVTEYMERENLNRSQLADKLGVTKGYISQILNGNFNYTLKKLIELSLSIDIVPRIVYHPLSSIIEQDVQDSFSLSISSNRLSMSSTCKAISEPITIHDQVYASVATEKAA